MALVAYIVLLNIFSITFGKDCVINNVPEQMAWEKQLEKDLSCNYHRSEPPSKNNSTLAVNLRFVMKYFTFNSQEEKISVYHWMYMSWRDERLEWDPEKYSGIKETEISSFRLWIPSLRLYNNANSYDFDRLFYNSCLLKYTGDILCVPKMVHQAMCSVNLKNWPYDVQECSLEFGTWTSKWHSFRMNISSRGITMLGAEYGAEWFISDYRQVKNESSERQLTMTFVLEREAAGLAAIVVYPAWILSVLSIMCLFLDARRRVRLGVACFSLLSHYYFLAELALDIPKQSISPPTILMYYRGSVIITVTILLFTFMLTGICKLKSTPQNYILSINEFVYESYGRYFVFPRWDIDDVPVDKRFSEDWTKFANIFNCVFSIIIVVSYISLYGSLVPKPVPISY